MRKVRWLRRLGLVSAMMAAGLATTPVAAHADGYDTPRTVTALGAGSNPNAGMEASRQRARAAMLAVGHDCTPGVYGTRTVYISPGGGTWVYETTHQATCVD